MGNKSFYRDFDINLPQADNLVTFKTDGPARNIGVENGDIRDFNSMKADSRKAFMGKCLMILQSTGQEGTVNITASAEGLAPAEITVKAVSNQ